MSKSTVSSWLLFAIHILKNTMESSSADTPFIVYASVLHSEQARSTIAHSLAMTDSFYRVRLSAGCRGLWSGQWSHRGPVGGRTLVRSVVPPWSGRWSGLGQWSHHGPVDGRTLVLPAVGSV